MVSHSTVAPHARKRYTKRFFKYRLENVHYQYSVLVKIANAILFGLAETCTSGAGLEPYCVEWKKELVEPGRHWFKNENEYWRGAGGGYRGTTLLT